MKRTIAKAVREYTEGDLLEARRRWCRLGERERTHLEWTHGNPYYTPSFGGECETYEEYESSVRNLNLASPDAHDASADARSDLVRAVELQRASAQKELFDSINTKHFMAKDWGATSSEDPFERKDMKVCGK